MSRDQLRKEIDEFLSCMETRDVGFICLGQAIASVQEALEAVARGAADEELRAHFTRARGLLENAKRAVAPPTQLWADALQVFIHRNAHLTSRLLAALDDKTAPS